MSLIWVEKRSRKQWSALFILYSFLKGMQIQYGYFSTQKGSDDRKIVEQEIKKLITKTERILSKLGDQEILLEEEVKKNEGLRTED